MRDYSISANNSYDSDGKHEGGDSSDEKDERGSSESCESGAESTMISGIDIRGTGIIEEENFKFDYAGIRKWNIIGWKEMISTALHDIKVKHKWNRESLYEVGHLLDAIGNKPYDHHTIQCRLAVRTGVKEILYDCCRSSCMSFAVCGDDIDK